MTRRLLLVGVAAAVVVALLVVAGARWTEARARAAADRSAAALAHAQLGLLGSELQKFRLLPLVLAEHPDVGPALAGDMAARARLDDTLELLAGRTDAAAIYAIDRTGRTVAASNWRTPASFVGQNYGFRPYFTEAMQRGAAELFALGTVSGRPGLYLARRVGRAGVIVVKVEFDAVEASWRRGAAPTLATDAHGVVLVTSVSAWRFTATGALDRATLTDARRTLQFGPAPPPRAPVRLAGRDATVGAERYRVGALPAPLAGGRLLVLAPLRPALAAARSQALLWALGLALLAGVAGGLALRAAEKRRLQVAARAALEREVAARTAELREANARLIVESDERADAERRFRAAREELAQANRLGSLGQIVAGVAHEINQPAAAIRTYAENGAVLLDRAAPDRARDNLHRIVGLADRIGAITAELRAFARRRTPAMGAVPLDEVLDGVRLLMGERMRRRVTVVVSADVRAARVVGDRIRLEQVLVNLLANALEATDGQNDAVVAVTAEREAATIALRVADNGPGIAAAVREGLFTPFVSAKPDGLGLGLAIARSIAREFGGDLALAPTVAAGATFVLTIRAA